MKIVTEQAVKNLYIGYLTRSESKMRSVVALAFILCTVNHPAIAQITLWPQPTTPADYATADSGEDRYVDIATDGASTWVAAWQSTDDLGGTIGMDLDILFSRSIDNGATWTTPVPLNINATTDTEDDFVPDLCTDEAGNWIAVWYSRNTLGGISGPEPDILVARSSNNGATWTNPLPLNSNSASDTNHDFFPHAATDGNGNWIVVWESLTIPGDWDIFVARSTNNGVSWSTVAALNTNAATDSGDDINVHLATDAAGNWVAVWSSEDALGGTIGTDYDILVSRSSSNGSSWSAPAPLNANAATDIGDDFFPQIATDAGGQWITVWSAYDTTGPDPDIVSARSSDNGATWSALTTVNHFAGADTTVDFYPDIAYDENGLWVVAWESSFNLDSAIGPDLDILCSRSLDGGATWSTAVTINSNATSDTGSDANVALVTDGNHNWVAAWQSTDTLTGTIGSDFDILVTPATDTDRDLVSDSNETTVYFTDPDDSDSDNDLLTDGDELTLYATDPLNPDTDGDGVWDSIEISLGTDPLDPFDFLVLPISWTWLLALIVGGVGVAAVLIRRRVHSPL